MPDVSTADLPFLKWAGGKRWLAHSEYLPQPKSFNRYIEPFLGGAAVFFRLRPATAILGDVNGELISLYEVMRDQPNDLYDVLQRHQKNHGKQHYYTVRADSPLCRVEQAARMLYLNRTCWNGLYRVNLKGEFNVPIGTKNTVLFDDEDFDRYSTLLRAADLRVSDFQTTIEEAVEGDFLFVDPPYTVRHNCNGFVKYNEQIFSWADQVRLCESVAAAVSRGASVVVTNADHPSVKELYEDAFEYRQLARASVLSGSAKFRGQTTEAMFIANI